MPKQEIIVQLPTLKNRLYISQLYIFTSTYIIKSMGGNQSRAVEPPRPIIPQPQELTALQRWHQSDHSQEDLLIFLQSSSGWAQCAIPITSFLTCITIRQKYQNCISILIDYFKQSDSNHGCSQNQRKELFLYLLLKLCNSFFIVDDFHEGAINVSLKPKQKLLFLYQYYSLNEQLLYRALLFNYPSIYTEFKQFVTELIEKEILITNQSHFLRFIVEKQKIDMIRQSFQEISIHLPPMQYQQSMQQLRLVHDMKRIFISAAAEFMKYDNADMAASVMAEIIRKGYHLSEQDYEYYLKIQFFSMFLYSLGKLSLSFSDFQKKSITELIQLFYDSKDIEDTPLLSRCFDIFDKNSNTKKIQSLLQYCFSGDAHISLLIRLLEHHYIEFSGTPGQFSGVYAKVISSRCEIGRYSDYLLKIADNFNIQADLRQKFIRLVKVIECMHVLGLDSVAVQEVYPVVYSDPSKDDNEKMMLYQESCLSLMKRMIEGFIKHESVITKKITIQGREHKFQKLYDFLNFLKVAKDYIIKQALSDTAIHQLLFSCLIKNGYYQEIQALLSQHNRKTYGLALESAQMLIIDHIVELLTTKKFRSIQQTITVLLNIININPKGEVYHFIAAYYKYFKYLQEKDIFLSPQQKQNLSISHLYYILDNYSNKMQTINFDYLFAQLSCIQQHYTDVSVVFVPVVTDEFLKFKVYLSNKCFDLKKIKLGNQLIEDVMQYQPPWLSADLANILRQNPNLDQSFINVAFTHCTRGQDLQYILKLYSKRQPAESSSSMLSLKKIKKFNEELTKQQKYVVLDNDLILNQVEYENLIAEMTYSRNQQFKEQYKLFFRLLASEPQRAFNYAVNYIKDVSFVHSFLMEAIRRNAIHMTHILPLLVRYLFFKLQKEDRDYRYIKYKQYLQMPMKEICDSQQKWNQKPSANVEVLSLFIKTIKNYQASLEITPSFLSLYVSENQQLRFIYDEGERKRIVLEIREQPMSKINAKVFKQLCAKISVDIVDLSLYELISRVNTKEEIDDGSWNIVQKLISWGDDKASALKILKRISQKIEILSLFLKICDYLRESEPIFKQLATDQHMDILVSLAAIEQDNNFFGIVPDNFFEREIGVHPHYPKGILSEIHRRILEQSGALHNIFILSKALYFMYGCDEEVEKVVLGQFSLKQEDSQEFEFLRKKIKYDTSHSS